MATPEYIQWLLYVSVYEEQGCRVLTEISTQRGRRFYNDIPTSFAEKIFPGLRDAGSCSLKSIFSILDQKSVLLHNTTLTNLLLNYQISQSRARTTEGKQYS